MSENITFSLKEIEEGFAIPIKEIVDYLSTQGYKIEANPDNRINSEVYNVLYKQFYARKKWKDTDNRFVAYLDIMGFKDLFSRNPHEKVLKSLQKISDLSTAEKKFSINYWMDKDGNRIAIETIHITMFSDSIFLFSKDDTILSFAMINLATASLFKEAIKSCIPMKGAMAFGLTTVNKEQNIYCGQPLIDSYLLHEEVNYYGIVAHHTIDKYFLEREVDEYHKNCYQSVKTPLKSGNIIHRNLNWFEKLSIPSVLRQYIPDEEFEEVIENLKSITSGAPRKYIDNTIEVYNSIYYP